MITNAALPKLCPLKIERDELIEIQDGCRRCRCLFFFFVVSDVFPFTPSPFQICLHVLTVHFTLAPILDFYGMPYRIYCTEHQKNIKLRRVSGQRSITHHSTMAAVRSTEPTGSSIEALFRPSTRLQDLYAYRRARIEVELLPGLTVENGGENQVMTFVVSFLTRLPGWHPTYTFVCTDIT
jgi:hypothetical protein